MMHVNDTTNSYNGVIESYNEDDLTKIAVVMVGVLSVSGTIGNALVIYVYARQKLKKTSTIFILTLACNDFATSLVTMPFTIVFELLSYKVQYDFVCKIYQFLVTNTVPLSAFLMAAIAFDRYLCVVYPLKHMVSMTLKRAKIIIAMLFLLATIFGLLSCLMYGTYSRAVTCVKTNFTLYINESDKPSRYREVIQQVHCNATYEEMSITIVRTGLCKMDDILINDSFKIVFEKIYASFYAVSAVVVIVLYAILYHTVLTRRRQHIKTAVMLSIVAAAYIVAFLPTWLMTIRVLTFNIVIFYIHFTYNVVNPLIYAFLNEKFRSQLRVLISCTRQPSIGLQSLS